MWLERGLISRYDEYVYKLAYKLGSYKTGCLVGRIRWYLEYGKNKGLKSELHKLLEKCHINSDNNPFIEKQINGVLPPTTSILNCEFETKRKYYVNNSVFFHGASRDMLEYYSKVEREMKRPFREELKPLYDVLKYRREIIEDLTNNKVLFVENNRDPESDTCDWWNRLRRVRIDDQPDHTQLEVYREYAQSVHGELVARNLMSNVSTFAMFKNNSVEEADFAEDMWDVLTSLNDNDFASKETTFKSILEGMHVKGYVEIRKRNARKLKNIVSKKKDREEKLEKLQETAVQLASEDCDDVVTIRKKSEVATCVECGTVYIIEEVVHYFGKVNGQGRCLCYDCSMKKKFAKKGIGLKW